MGELTLLDARRRGCVTKKVKRVPAAYLQELDVLLRTSGITRRSGLSLPVCSADDADLLQADHRRRLSARIGRVVTFIDDNLDAALSVERLAEEAELSKYHFARTFRQEVGKSPWSYVREARVRKAKELLDRGDPPATAAVDAGFYDQSHLTHVMRDVEGTTPKRYQAERRRRERKDLQE